MWRSQREATFLASLCPIDVGWPEGSPFTTRRPAEGCGREFYRGWPSTEEFRGGQTQSISLHTRMARSRSMLPVGAEYFHWMGRPCQVAIEGPSVGARLQLPAGLVGCQEVLCFGENQKHGQFGHRGQELQQQAPLGRDFVQPYYAEHLRVYDDN